MRETRGKKVGGRETGEMGSVFAWMYTVFGGCTCVHECSQACVSLCVCESVFVIMTGCHHTVMWSLSCDINPLPVLPSLGRLR